jgi:hypothetical protein
MPVVDAEPDRGSTRASAARRCGGASDQALRVLALLALIGVLNLADLIYTLCASSAGLLSELNPLAAALLGKHMELDLVCLKVITVAVGCIILWRLRMCRWTLGACWLLVAIYSGLACTWIAWAAQYDIAMQTRVAWATLATSR